MWAFVKLIFDMLLITPLGIFKDLQIKLLEIGENGMLEVYSREP